MRQSPIFWNQQWILPISSIKPPLKQTGAFGFAYQVESVGDAAMLWEHLGNTQPDLVLLDAHSDGFGAMTLFFDIKEKLPDLAVIVYQCRNYGDADRIKGAVADELLK